MSVAFRVVAVNAARSAGALLREHLGGPRRVRQKGGPSDVVTDMDRRAEAQIVRALRTRFPDHAILAEERGRMGASRHRWIIDPLDGTTNYAHGLPIFAVSIALSVDGVVRLGVVYDPMREECFVAERGRGATLNDAPLAVSATRRLSSALVATGLQYSIRDRRRTNLAEHAALLARCQSVRELGSAVLCLAAVAAGRMDAFWELELRAWDVAAGGLLVEEAGGALTDPAGHPVNLAAPAVVASNGIIHRQLLRVLADAEGHPGRASSGAPCHRRHSR
jgi:myo-inositol-1(or 4)-monophosphatase